MNRKILIIVIVLILSITLLIANLYPIMYKENINKYSKIYELDPFLVLSVIKQESSFDKDATSKKSAKGLMQISNITGEWASETLELDDFQIDDLYDEKTNIMIGTWYLNKLIKQFGDIDLALAAYNAGSGNVQTWLKDKSYSEDGKKLDQIPFKETRDYVYKVQKYYNVYKNIYWHPYFLENENILDKSVFKTRGLITKIVRKLR